MAASGRGCSKVSYFSVMKRVKKVEIFDVAVNPCGWEVLALEGEYVVRLLVHHIPPSGYKYATQTILDISPMDVEELIESLQEACLQARGGSELAARVRAVQGEDG